MNNSTKKYNFPISFFVDNLKLLISLFDFDTLALMPLCFECQDQTPSPCLPISHTHTYTHTLLRMFARSLSLFIQLDPPAIGQPFSKQSARCPDSCCSRVLQKRTARAKPNRIGKHKPACGAQQIIKARQR